MIETHDGIVSPSNGDKLKLVQDLGTMAASVQEALYKRANSYKGTSSQRMAFLPQAVEGEIWKDTDGIKGLWSKQGTSWVRLWPLDLEEGAFIIGTRDRHVATPGQLQLRRFFPNDNSNSHANLLMSDSVNNGLVIVNWRNRQVSSQIQFRHNGQIEVITLTGGRTSRFLPFATYSGSVVLEPQTANSVTSVTVQFPAGFFTAAPHINLTANTAAPQTVSLGVSGVSASAFNINMHRTSVANTRVYWEAIQRVATSHTNPNA